MGYQRQFTKPRMNDWSLVCLQFGRLPIPPEYLPDPPKLSGNRMRANDLSKRRRHSSPFGHARYGDLKENLTLPGRCSVDFYGIADKMIGPAVAKNSVCRTVVARFGIEGAE
jgi:hypothetical protein